MAEYDRSGTCRSASWRTTAARLLRNSTRSQSATLTEIELTGLCITFQQCQSDQLLGLHNIGVIRDFFLDPKRQIQKRLMLMSIACSSFGRYSSVEHHSRYSSSLLVDFISDLSEHATRYIHDERGQIHMKHHASPGKLLDMHIAIPEANGSTSQYIAVIRRQREQPESLPTLTELYSLFSSAAMFKKQKTHARVIKVRLFIVYSSWVQVLSATAPLSYIMSILERRDHIEGNMEISESPWFNLLSLPDLERLLLFAFESATLAKHKRIPDMFSKLRQSPQSQTPKRKIIDLKEGELRKGKSPLEAE